MSTSARTPSAHTHDAAMEIFHGDVQVMDVDDPGMAPQVTGGHAVEGLIFSATPTPTTLGPLSPQVTHLVPLPNGDQIHR